MKNIKRFAFVLIAMSLAILPQTDLQAGHSRNNVDKKDLTVGTGGIAVRHSQISVLYSGALMDGTVFDSSLDKNSPFKFTLGGGQVIPGWDMGIEGMKVGGKRELIIPPELAYGKQGSGPIPPDATLRFEVELVSVQLPKYNNIDNATLKTLRQRGVKIVDIRRKDEWQGTGVVQGSKLLTAFDSSGRFIPSFPKQFQAYVDIDEEVILICRTGNRSSVLAHALSENAGYRKVYNVTSGIVDWIDGGNLVVRQ